MKYMIFLVCLLCTKPCAADSLAQHWTPATKLALAQCLFAEVGPDAQAAERAAIAHVLVKRWVLQQGHSSTNLIDMILRYCSVHHATRPTAKQRAIRRLAPGAPVPSLLSGARPAVVTAKWECLLLFVDDFASVLIPDPLPAALHFGSSRDHKKRVRTGKLGKVRLLPRTVTDPFTGRQVRLSNLFYAGAS